MRLQGGCAAGALGLVLALCVAAGGLAAPADPLGHRTVDLGSSVDGRAIRAVETGDLDATQRALVVGCIHGNEPAGIAVANVLARVAPTSELDLWIVPVLNPDGVAARTRGNARGVDLNRNFPWGWRRLRGVFYSGPKPLSEPESRAASHLIARIDPLVSVWFHQHEDVVDESGGQVAIERRFARLAGLGLARLRREPGSVVGWENHRDPAATAFVVELPAGALSSQRARRFAHAVLTVATAKATDGSRR
jgi:murein peptide amidase A